MKVLTVVGARPQFIKAAMVSPILRKENKEILVHTGQHYDHNMSQVFFDELGIPVPDFNLGISGGSHAQMTGKMMMALEEVMIEQKPDCILLYGDTNSTLAAALSASKLCIPICHVEAGLRTHSRTNPEEQNRICTDHLSQLLLSATELSMKELVLENLGDRAILVGDPMFDAFVKYKGILKRENIDICDLENRSVELPEKYYYLTCHREENTKDAENLKEILRAMNDLEYKVVYPVHPRNRKEVLSLIGKNRYSNILFINPVGYLSSVFLVDNCVSVVTDSGGVQREAFFAQKKCVTLLDFAVWQETMVGHRNDLSKPEYEDIIKKIHTPQVCGEVNPFGDGHAGTKIVMSIMDLLEA